MAESEGIGLSGLLDRLRFGEMKRISADHVLCCSDLRQREDRDENGCDYCEFRGESRNSAAESGRYEQSATILLPLGASPDLGRTHRGPAGYREPHPPPRATARAFRGVGKFRRTRIGTRRHYARRRLPLIAPRYAVRSASRVCSASLGSTYRRQGQRGQQAPEARLPQPRAH